MLVPNLHPNVVPHRGSRLLLDRIVRARGRLVAGKHSRQAVQARPALLLASEVLTLAILARWPRFRSGRDFWRFAQAQLRSYFPKLVSQSQLNRRIRALGPEVQASRAIWPARSPSPRKPTE